MEESYTVIDGTSEFSQGNGRFVIDSTMEDYLKTTSGWAIFLAVLGFISAGLMIIGGFFAGAIFSMVSNARAIPFNSFTISSIYIFFGLLLFFPALYMMRFANKTRDALATGSQDLIRDAFMNLKSYYKFTGIMVAALMGVYLLVIIGAIGLGSIS